MKTSTLFNICLVTLTSYLIISPAIAAPPKDVNVVNTPLVNVNTDVRTPFHTDAIATDWTTNSVNIIVDIPTGNRFVIEHISASAFMHPQVELTDVAIYPHANGTSTAHVFALPEVAPGFTGSNTYSGSHSVRIYTDQSFLVRFTKVSVGGSLELGTASIAVSGYLIPYTSSSLAP